MNWEVKFTAKAQKQANKLAENKYHCHLNYRWVACWQIEDNKLKIIEIYFVGSRENAPY